MTCPRFAGSGTWVRRARLPSSRRGSILLGPGKGLGALRRHRITGVDLHLRYQWLTHRGSVGIVVAGEMKVLDDDGNPCPSGEVGEIYMRPSPGSAPTYRYSAPTAKCRDGWDSLGDLGYFDADGFCTFGSPGRHVHCRRPQRLPGRDRECAR